MQRRDRIRRRRERAIFPDSRLPGEIVAVGEGVGEWKAGDRGSAPWSRVEGTPRCAWRPHRKCLPVPANLDVVSAAAIPETFFTVWTNVFDRGRLSPGEDALFHGGSSGIGTTAIQIARARGSRVFVTAGSDEKCRACEQLGAAHAINYKTRDFVEAVRELTQNRGVDLILDIIGGSYVGRNLSALAVDGRLVQIGVQSGETTVSVDLWRILSRRLTVTGSTLRARSVEEKGQIAVRAAARNLAVARERRGEAL
jgi:NADPH:quinone reductase-like Zn-dependent oxidoreductase